ncbi:MAG: DUF924 family protein [Oligoflexales bacterium]
MEFLAKKVLEFWFGEIGEDGKVKPEVTSRWFKKDQEFDQVVKKKFAEYLYTAYMGAFDRWISEPLGSVALIIMLDQFPRNIYRSHAKSFHFDTKALSVAKLFADSVLYLQVLPVFGQFALMPFMHSEDLAAQKQGLDHFKLLKDKCPDYAKPVMESVYEFAVKHHDIIERFGRFPHRNEILARESTEEELSFLKEPGSSF